MAGEVFAIVGEVSGEQYASLCMPLASDYDTAYALNSLYDHVKSRVRWANTETLNVVVRYPTDPTQIELSKI